MDETHLSQLVSMLAMAAAVFAVPTPSSAQTITFAGEQIGALPKNFESALTGQGQSGRWEVVEDATADGGRVLGQLNADSTDYRFPLAIYASVNAADVEITTRFKALSGKVDQAGGVVVRFSDPNNYYVARANALEDNVRFYRVVGGKRQELASANLKVSPREWHSLTLRAEGDRFAVSFDGKLLHTTTDNTFTTPGKVGLWTKADSITHFERIEIKTLPRS
jgi:hypothetical protein